MKLWILVVMVLSVYTQVLLSVSAQTVSPMVLDYKAEARTIEHATITVTNTLNARVDIFPTVNPISVGEGGGIEEFITPSQTDRTMTLSSWLEISRAPLELNPGETKTVPLTLRVHPSPEPGSYHALVAFPIGSNRDEAEARVQSGTVPGVIVNVTIEDKRVERMSLSKFNIERFILSNDNSAASYLVENTGDSDMKPSGDILIYNQRGEEVGAIVVNPEGKVVKPGEVTTFTAHVPVDNLIGKYKAYLSLHYGNTQRAQLQDTAFFYAIPWKKLLVLFVGLILVAVALSLLIHRRMAPDEDEVDEDGDYVPLMVREGVSSPVPHDIDMKPRI